MTEEEDGDVVIEYQNGEETVARTQIGFGNVDNPNVVKNMLAQQIIGVKSMIERNTHVSIVHCQIGKEVLVGDRNNRVLAMQLDTTRNMYLS